MTKQNFHTPTARAADPAPDSPASVILAHRGSRTGMVPTNFDTPYRAHAVQTRFDFRTAGDVQAFIRAINSLARPAYLARPNDFSITLDVEFATDGVVWHYAVRDTTPALHG